MFRPKPLTQAEIDALNKKADDDAKKYCEQIGAKYSLPSAEDAKKECPKAPWRPSRPGHRQQ